MFGRILDILFSMKNVHFGRGTHVEFVFDHLWLIILGAVVLAAIGYSTYLPQAAAPGKKVAMGILRAALLVIVLCLVCRPQLVAEHEIKIRSIVAVWVDTSASMSLQDTYNGARSDPKMRDYMHKVAQQINASASGATPARVSRFEMATTTLANTQWLHTITESQDVLFFTGYRNAEAVGLATNAQEVDARIAQIKGLKPEGSTTDVPAIVRDILQRSQGQRLSAIVLLTDGQTTEPGSRLDQAGYLAQNVSANIFALPVGQNDDPFDLKITTMRLPESTFSRDPVSARLHIAATGLSQATPVKVTVFRKKADGTVDTSVPLASKELTLDPGKTEIDTDLPIRLKKTDPGKSERFDLVARLEPAGAGTPEERTLDNNEKSRTVLVLDAQINVLYVEGYPRWEYRYLKNELIREPTVNVSTLLLTGDEGWVQDADPAVNDKVTGEELFPGAINHFPDNAQDLAKYDVLLIGDVEPTYFSPTQQKLIVDWVKTKGAGVGWIAGNRWNPEAYRESALEVLLPVIPDEIDPRARVLPPSDNTAFLLNLTPAGKETNLFRFFDDPEESWKQVSNLPDMYWYKPVQGLKPGSIVLANNPKRSVNGNPAPLLVQRQFGAGPVLFAAYTDTWRWRRYTGEPLFQSYWLQLCRLLYTSKALGASKRLELGVQSNQVEIGNQIKATLTIKDSTLSGQVPAEVAAMVVDKQGRTVQTITLTRPTVAQDPTALEHLEGSAAAQQLGEFTLQIQPGAAPVEVTPVELSVEQPQREFQTVTADRGSLESLTKTANDGGELKPPYVYAPYDAEDLAKQMRDRSQAYPRTLSEDLWNKPFALILVVLVASIEWLVRKSAGLI
jgi:hypothetical protein